MARVRLRDTETRPSRLPEVCMVCGEPSVQSRKRVFGWFPWWAGLPLVLAIIPGIVTVMLFAKRRTVHVPSCQRHRRYFATRGLLMWLPLIALVILIPVALLAPPFILDTAVAEEEGKIMWYVLGACLALAILTVVILLNTGVRATEITDEDMIISGVDRDFSEAMADLREERRRSQREDDERDDDDRPRRRSRDDDDDYDDRPRRQRRDDDDDHPRRRASHDDDDYDDRPRRRRRDDD